MRRRINSDFFLSKITFFGQKMGQKEGGPHVKITFFLSKYGYRTSDKVPHNLSRGWTFELLLEKKFCDPLGYLTVFGLACNNYYHFLPLSPRYEPIVVDDKSKHESSGHTSEQDRLLSK